MKNTWKLLKLGVYVFALPLVATAAASAHQWMSVNTAIATVPAIPVASAAATPARMTAIRNYTITLNEDGEVQGRVASINHKSKSPTGLSEVTVYFAQNGRVVQKAYTNEDGTFVAKGLTEGVYSFIAGNEVSFAACGVNVVKSDDGSENYIEVASISPNVKVVRELIESSLPEAVRTSFTSSNKEVAEVAGSNRVELDGDTLKGRIVSLVSDELTAGTVAHLFKGNDKVSEFEIATDGTFEVAGVTAGVHDIVVLGKDGMAAVSFEAVGPVDETSKEAYTAMQDSVFSNFVVALAPQCDGGCVTDACSSCGGFSDAVIYDNGPASFIGDRLGGGIAGGGCCGGASNFTNFGGGCCGGGVGGRFSGLFSGRGRLLIPAIAAGIAIPLAIGGESQAAPN